MENQIVASAVAQPTATRELQFMAILNSVDPTVKTNTHGNKYHSGSCSLINKATGEVKASRPCTIPAVSFAKGLTVGEKYYTVVNEAGYATLTSGVNAPVESFESLLAEGSGELQTRTFTPAQAAATALKLNARA